MPQAELHSVTGALAGLDEDLDMIQQQLEHQMQAQDQNQDDARSVMLLYTQCACLLQCRRCTTAAMQNMDQNQDDARSVMLLYTQCACLLQCRQCTTATAAMQKWTRTKMMPGQSCCCIPNVHAYCSADNAQQQQQQMQAMVIVILA